MRKLFIVSILSFLSSIIHAQQCERVANNLNGPNNDYVINGSATLAHNGNILTLTFSSNFSTVAGPDLYVYLGTKNENPTNIGNPSVQLGFMGNNTSGEQSYQVPSNVDINDYNFVLIHCVEYNHFWGGGELDACSAVGIEELDETGEVFEIRPNPFTSSVSISSASPHMNSYQLEVKNLQGNTVLNTFVNDPTRFAFGENLLPGMYIGIITDGTKQYSFRVNKI